MSVPFLAGSDWLPTPWYSSVWGAHREMRAVLLHPRLTVKGHSRFWLSHRLIGSFFLVVSRAHCFCFGAVVFPTFFVGSSVQLRFGPLGVCGESFFSCELCLSLP